MTVALVHTPATELRHSSATSVSGAITPPTAGNLLVAIWSSYTATEAVTTDNQGNAWRKIADVLTPGGNFLLSIHYAMNVATGTPFNVTFDTNSTGHGISGFVSEVASTDLVSPREESEIRTRSGTGTLATTPPMTNSALDAIVFAAAAIDDPTDPITLSSPGSPWSVVGEELLGSTYESLSILSRVVSASVDSSAAWSIANVGWATLIAVFQGTPTLFGPPPGRGPG